MQDCTALTGVFAGGSTFFYVIFFILRLPCTLTFFVFVVTLSKVMVNEKSSTKYSVLEILREEEEPVSGEEIAAQTGVSRVSVWKAIQSLQSAGYGISSSKKGYFLAKDIRDSLFPWEFGAEEQLVEHFLQTESTMIEARRIAECSDRTVRIITADSQTNGYGKNNAPWTTTKGSLAFTIITRSQIPVAESHRIMMAAQIAWAEVLSDSTERRFFVRWPNDIWTELGKTGGILDEISASGSLCRWLNLGIGINITQKPELSSALCDCAFPGGTHFTRRELLSSFLRTFSKYEHLATEEPETLSKRWNSLCCDIGRTVQTTDADGLPVGRKAVFKGVDASGFVLLSYRRAGRNRKRLYPPGAISFIKTKI